MLHGIRENAIIAGAYTHPRGICPMLAAHRAGGRTSAISFARAWDRFVFRGARVNRPRPATAGEVMVLTAHVEASLLAEAPDLDLGAAIASHRELIAQRDPGPVRPAGSDRASELRECDGWSWMRVVRTYGEHERAVEQLEGEQAASAQTGCARSDDREHELV